MSGGRHKKVTLSGVLANKPVPQINWTFVLSLVDGKKDSGLIDNIRMGTDIKMKGKPGTPGYQPAAFARALTCWHCTQRGQNFTVFFRWVAENPGPIIVIGYGKHGKDNKTYKVEWADGSTETINLDSRNQNKSAPQAFAGIGRN